MPKSTNFPALGRSSMQRRPCLMASRQGGMSKRFASGWLLSLSFGLWTTLASPAGAQVSVISAGPVSGGPPGQMIIGPDGKPIGMVGPDGKPIDPNAKPQGKPHSR